MTVRALPTLGESGFEHYRSRFPITALAPWRPSVSNQPDPPGTADDVALSEISSLVEIVGTMFIGDLLYRGLLDHASTIACDDDISDTLADAWTEEARELGKNANLMRSLAAEAREAIEEAERVAKQGSGAHAQSSVFVVFRQATEQADTIADLMEDVAETQALAAHRPFRECVKRELEAAGAA